LLTNPSDFGPVFRRGLPDYACLSLDTFLKNGEAIFDAYPTLRELALYGVANCCTDITMSPLLAKLDTLEIADWPTEVDAYSLSVSPHLDKIKRFKLWLGEEEMPYFLRELVKQADARWPREIELVQVFGGGGSGVPAAVGWREHYREQADQAARFANTAIGRPVACVSRPFERLFPLVGDVGYGLFAGHLPDGRPALAGGTFNLWLLIVFDNDGRVADSTTQDNGIVSNLEGQLDSATVAWVQDELRLVPGLIWVREFNAPGVNIALWPHHCFDPESPSDPVGGRARGWLERQEFLIWWGSEPNDYWADWRGKIHSS
jgi:hypothetical protein